jgi:site-specific recombinase XerD
LKALAASSRAHHVSAVRSFLRFCREQGALDRAPSDLLVRPRVAVASFNRYLDLDELRRLVAAARELSPRHFAAVMLMAGTGLRVAEAAAAEWRDLSHDPEGRLGLRVVGKGSKERVVKVRDDVFSALVALHGNDALDASLSLLVNSRGTAYSTRGLHKLVIQASWKAGIDKPVSPHWLRHSHATLAAVGGASGFTVQVSLGHSRLETSQRYVHWARPPAHLSFARRSVSPSPAGPTYREVRLLQVTGAVRTPSPRRVHGKGESLTRTLVKTRLPRSHPPSSTSSVTNRVASGRSTRPRRCERRVYLDRFEVPMLNNSSWDNVRSNRFGWGSSPSQASQPPGLACSAASGGNLSAAPRLGLRKRTRGNVDLTPLPTHCAG